MPVTSLFDLIPNCASDVKNVVPFFDGCDWKLIQLPEGTDCASLVSCIQENPCIIGNLFHSNNNSIIINSCTNIEVNLDWLKSAIPVSISPDNCTLNVGLNSVNLCTILDGVFIVINDGISALTIKNGETININGLDGLRFITQPNNTVAVGLPLKAQHMQVLTWDDDNKKAVWANNQCCTPTLIFNNGNVSTPGGGTIDITSVNTDNQTLSYDPSIDKNLLQISILTGMSGTTPIYGGSVGVNLTHVNEHTLGLVGNDLSIFGCTGLLHNTVVLNGVNRHTLTLSGNFLSIVSADGMVNDTEELIVNNHVLGLAGNILSITNSNGTATNNVDLGAVNNHTISIHPTDENILQIFNSNGDLNAVADLHEVNNHYFTITPNVGGWFDLKLFNSNDVLQSEEELPRPDIFDCTDVEACMASTINALNLQINNLQGEIDALETLVSGAGGLLAQISALEARVLALETAIIP